MDEQRHSDEPVEETGPQDQGTARGEPAASSDDAGRAKPKPAAGDPEAEVSGDPRTGGGTGQAGAGDSGAGDDDIGTGMLPGGAGVDMAAGVVSSAELSEEEHERGPVLNHPYGTGDAYEYGTGGGDVGIGGDVTPHGQQHDPTASAHDVAESDDRFKDAEIVDEGGYLERSGFPEEWPDATDEAESEDDPFPEAESLHRAQPERAVSEPDEPFADVRDEDDIEDVA
jgi:hypothetical protein